RHPRWRVDMEGAVERVVTKLGDGLALFEGEAPPQLAYARTIRTHHVLPVERQPVDARAALLVDGHGRAPVDADFQPRLPGHLARCLFRSVLIQGPGAALTFVSESDRRRQLPHAHNAGRATARPGPLSRGRPLLPATRRKRARVAGRHSGRLPCQPRWRLDLDVAVEGLVTELENGLTGFEGEMRGRPGRPHDVLHIERQAVDAGSLFLVDDHGGAFVDPHR